MTTKPPQSSNPTQPESSDSTPSQNSSDSTPSPRATSRGSSSDSSTSQHSSDPTPPPRRGSTARGVLSDIGGGAKAAFRKGSSDAADAVEQTLPAVKRSIAKGVYLSCYYLAFGAVYGAKMAMELVPENSVIRDGLRHGADAANEAYDRRLTDQDESPGYVASTVTGD